MSFRPYLAALLFIHGFLGAQDFMNLPDWAQPIYTSSRNLPKPDGVDDWVLLDRTEFAYTGDGEIAIHRYRVEEVLTNRGVSAGVFSTIGLGGGASKVKKLKGWNLRPDGEMIRLDSSDVVTVDKPGDSNGISNQRLTGVGLARVVTGSVIVFESLQVQKNPGGPTMMTGVMEQNPILRWEIRAATQAGWFKNLKKVSYSIDFSHFSPWIKSPTVLSNVSITADNVPPIPKGENATPYAWNMMPRVVLKFMDPDLKDVPLIDSWDHIASWTESIYSEKAAPLSLPIQPAPSGQEGLESIHRWMNEQLTYKQVYLSPERGIVPLDATQVLRRRYGDCKDLAICFMAAARAAGFETFPVLARIEHERIEPNEPVNPACFNHVIAAVGLKQTLNLDSEVVTPVGRFLLVDLTARFTPLGKLPDAHSNGRLMICVKGKGVWIEVAETALERHRIEAVLTGSGDRTGQIHGNLLLKEWGNSRGLRSAALGMSAPEYQRFLFSSFLALPSNAHIQILHHGDPLKVAIPFEVEIGIDNPTGFEIRGSEWELNAMGIFRMIPPIIHKAGQPRRFPIETFGRETVAIQANITVPGHLTPTLSSRVGGTAFHDFLWEAKAQSLEGGKTMLSLRFNDSQKPARFGFETKENGLAEWMKDRRMMQDVIGDALVFKTNP